MPSGITINVGCSTWRFRLVLWLLNMAAWLGLEPESVWALVEEIPPGPGEHCRFRIRCKVKWR